MNPHHKNLLQEIKQLSSLRSARIDPHSHSGSPHPTWNLNVPQLRTMVKTWLKKNQDLSNKEVTNLLASLYSGSSNEEKKLPGYLLSSLDEYRSQVDLQLLNNWLEQLVGWQEVDNTCQGVFSAEDVLSRWSEWKPFLFRLSKDKNMNKRRAALVLLTTPVSSSKEKELADLSLTLIDVLKSEKDKLITKAVSWLLRSLIKNHKTRVEDYIEQNLLSLPKIAIRETKNKLATGKK